MAVNKHKHALEKLKYSQSVLNNITNNGEKQININKLLTSALPKSRVPDKSLNIVSHHHRYYKPKHSVSGIIRKRSLSDLKQDVNRFYLEDEKSFPAPGSRDYVTRKKRKMRKRYLCDTIENLHRKYCKERGKIISRALFYKLKAFWMVHKKETARHTCLCKVHSNFQFLVTRLRYLNIKILNNTEDVKTMVCCSKITKECMYRECDNCINKKLEYSGDLTVLTWYNEWITEKLSRPGAKGIMYNVQVTSKKKIDCKILDVINLFNSKLPNFLKHVYIVTHQFQAIKNYKTNLKSNEVFLIIDFSENYVCKYHKEVQSVQFGASKKQISLQTGAFYYVDANNEQQCITFSSISDCLRHDTAAAWALLQPVFELLKKCVPQVEIINFLSDGPSTQYKNKTNFYLFNYFCSKLKIKRSTWNFTGAGHGKSVADGVGGSLKSLCD